MLKKPAVLQAFLFAFLLFAVEAYAFADDQGCFTPRYNDCLAHSTGWQGDRMTITLTNHCEGRLYVRVCNRAQFGDDCGQIGISAGNYGRWSTANAHPNGSAWWQYTGSLNSANDWVCANRINDWGMDPLY